MGMRQIGHGKPVVRLGLTMLLWLILVIVAPPLALATSDKPMTFRLEPNTPAARSLHALLDAGDRTIYADGEITPGTTARFLAFVRTHHLTRARVYLDSPGGSVTDALEFGNAIRELHFNTDVGAEVDPGPEPTSICASACVYAYAGGEGRFLGKGSG